MNLSEMTLDDLEQLLRDLGTLHKAALPLQALGIEGAAVDELRINLTPGFEAKIHTGWRMPVAYGATDLGPFLIEPLGSPSTIPDHVEVESPSVSADLSETDVASQAPAATVATVSQADQLAETVAQPCGGDVGVIPVTAPVLSADILPIEDAAGPLVPGGWTTADERLLVQIVALRVARGGTVASAIREVSAAIGRSPVTCNSRLYTKLRNQYSEALSAAKETVAKLTQPKPHVALMRPSIAKPQGQPDPAPIATAPAKPAVRIPVATPVSSTPKAAQTAQDTGRVEEKSLPKAGGTDSKIAPQLPARQREIADQLALAPRRKGYDAELDLEIVEGFSKGMKAAQLALDLDLDSKDMLERFRELSACIRNDRGQMSFEDQGHLIAILRQKVKEGRASAA